MERLAFIIFNEEITTKTNYLNEYNFKKATYNHKIMTNCVFLLWTGVPILILTKSSLNDFQRVKY